MKTISQAFVVISFLSIVPTTDAEELTSGLAVGKTMLSMPMEKRGGIDDGVRTGDAICYT